MTRLLRGEHIDMEERLRHGLSINEGLLYSEVLEHLARVLESVERFPAAPQEESGENPMEGVLIHREAQGRFRSFSAHTNPIDPTLVAHRCSRVFDSAVAAAEYYLKWELKLPGDLDGWKVRA